MIAAELVGRCDSIMPKVSSDSHGIGGRYDHIIPKITSDFEGIGRQVCKYDSQNFVGFSSESVGRCDNIISKIPSDPDRICRQV